MGIRAHKVLGYGLTDVVKEDERVNWDSVLLSYEKTSGREYLRWLEGRREKGFSLDLVMLRHDPGLLTADLRNRCVTWQQEFGLKNVLVITPMGVQDWIRFDDSIDYMEESYLKPKGQENWVRKFEHGIHPFNGIYMDARTGDRLGPEAVTWVRMRSNLRKGEPALAETRAAMDEVTRELTPFSSFEEASENIAPMPPQEVRDIAEYGSLFTGPQVWVQLRPVLYTYWG